MKRYILHILLLLIIFQFLIVTEISAKEIKFQDVSGIDYQGKPIIDSIRKSSYEKGLEYGTMVILFTHQLEIKNSNFKDKELLILVSSSNELRKNIIIFADQKIYKDTLLEFNCWFDKEGLDLCYDTLELPLGSSEGILLPELPSCWSGNNYFSFIHFKKDSAYYFEANILKHKIFLDNPQKKKKREELAIRISNCLVEFINKLVI